MRHFNFPHFVPFVLLVVFVLFLLVGCAQIHQGAYAETKHDAYASVSFGSGKAYGEETTGDKTMKRRAFEVRFGKNLAPPVVNADGGISNKLRIDIVHYNEGHPDNNHRDGFALQAVYNAPLAGYLDAEAALGPYFSMNTTTRGGVEHNKQNLGILLSLAALFNLDRVSQGMHVRFALNHVTMPGAHSSNALLVGLGKYFGGVASGTSARRTAPVWLSMAVGNSKTNHAGTEADAGYSFTAKRYYGKWAASIAGIAEGDDKVRLDRKGIGVQGWFVQPLTAHWTASAGFGPYVATNQRGSGDPELHGLFTLQLDRSIGKAWKAFASFSRVTDFSGKNDRDLGRIGIAMRFGG